MGDYRPRQQDAMQEDDQGRVVVYRTDFGGSRVKASKAELVKLLELEYAYAMPNMRQCSICFLRGVISGNKLLLKKTAILKLYGYELYPELSIDQVLAFARERIPNFDSYMPDNATNAMIDRKYLLDLVNSLIPNSMEDRHKEAIRRSKAGGHQNGAGQPQIVLAEEFQNIFSNRLIPLGSLKIIKEVLSACLQGCNSQISQETQLTIN